MPGVFVQLQNVNCIASHDSSNWLSDVQSQVNGKALSDIAGLIGMYGGTYFDMLSEFAKSNAGTVYKYASNGLSAIELTAKEAKYYTRLSVGAGVVSKYIGTAGVVISGGSLLYKYANNKAISTAEAVSFGIGATFLAAGSLASIAAAGTALAAAAPFIAGAAILYGVGEIISYSTTGQTLEEHIFNP